MSRSLLDNGKHSPDGAMTEPASLYRLGNERVTFLWLSFFMIVGPILTRATGFLQPKGVGPDFGLLTFLLSLLSAYAVGSFIVGRRTKAGKLVFDSSGITVKVFSGAQIALPWKNIQAVAIYTTPGINAFQLAIDVTDLDGLLQKIPKEQRRRVSKQFVFGPDMVLIETVGFKITGEQLRTEIEKRSSILTTYQKDITSLTVSHEFRPQFSDREYPPTYTWGATLAHKLGYTIAIACFSLIWWVQFTSGATNRGPFILTGVFVLFVASTFLMLAWQLPFLRFDERGMLLKGHFVPSVLIPWGNVASSRTTVSLADHSRTLEVCLVDKDAFLDSVPKAQKSLVDSQLATKGVIAIPLARLGCLPQELQPEVRKRIDLWQASQYFEEQA